jgi:hypothetical protein
MLNRRQSVFAGLNAALFLFYVRSGVGAKLDRPDLSTSEIPLELEQKTADSWIKEWGVDPESYKSISGSLKLQRFKDPTYVLLDSIRWRPDKGNENFASVKVPKGFVTDFASVPRVFWSIFRPDGEYAYAATIHDYLYWEQDRPKEQADKIFKYVMHDLAITDNEAFMLYRAVDLFGGDAWNANKKLKDSGENRILTVLPENPKLTWAEWRSFPSNFK